MPISDDENLVLAALDAVPFVPTPVWGRDELGAGEMWNSNSVVSWIVAVSGLVDGAGGPPQGGRAPGWDAGITFALSPALAIVGLSVMPIIGSANRLASSGSLERSRSRPASIPARPSKGSRCTVERKARPS